MGLQVVGRSLGTHKKNFKTRQNEAAKIYNMLYIMYLWL